MENIIIAIITTIGTVACATLPFIFKYKKELKEARKEIKDLEYSAKKVQDTAENQRRDKPNTKICSHRENNVDIARNYAAMIDWDRVLNNASHDVFLYSLSHSKLQHATKQLKEFCDTKTLRILSINEDDEESFMTFAKMRYGDGYKKCIEKTKAQTVIAKKVLDELTSDRKNIFRRVANRLVPCIFVAIDCGIDMDKNDSFEPSENSIIEAYFLIPDISCHEETILITALHGTELFTSLKHFIECLWRESACIESTDL